MRRAAGHKTLCISGVLRVNGRPVIGRRPLGYSGRAVVAGIGTLKGPLHGGANAEVMKLLLDLGQSATP